MQCRCLFIILYRAHCLQHHASSRNRRWQTPAEYVSQVGAKLQQGGRLMPGGEASEAGVTPEHTAGSLGSNPLVRVLPVR